MAETHRSYEDGLRDGKIEALEKIAGDHGGRLDSHSRRLRLLERIMWAGGGIVVFIEIAPQFKALLALVQ